MYEKILKIAEKMAREIHYECMRGKKCDRGEVVAAVSNWILVTGFWRDIGIWIDTENWID